MVRNNASFELSVSEIPDNSGTPRLTNFWEVVGDKFSTNTRISLAPFDNTDPMNPVLGEISYAAFQLDEPGPPAERPALVAFEAGARLHGGGIVNWQGDGFWGSVDTNHDWPADFVGSDHLNRREMLFEGFDTTAAGSDPINLTLRLAATPGGFEPRVDAFEVWVDPEDDGSFLQVAHFAGDTNSNLVPNRLNPDTGQNLDWIGIPDEITISTVMQTVTISLPPSMNFQPNARVKIRSYSTWINELIAWDDVVIHTRSLSAGAPNGQLALSGSGETYTQDFDSLGTPGSTLPAGWSATTGGTTNSIITLPFPALGLVTTAVYNAGKGAQTDRTLATGNVDGAASNVLQLWSELTGPQAVGAVVLNTRIEAWAGDSSFADDPGEAAYLISLEFDPEKDGTYDTAVTFNGGAPVTTGVTLSPGSINGNAGANSADFASGLVVLASQIPAGSDIRLTFDAQGVGQTEGYIFGVDDLLFRIVAPGDTDGSGELDSDDLFAIIDAGKFNHPELGPASWAEGDFNGDDLVNSTDLFLILATGKYNQGPYTTATPSAALATVPEPSSIVLAVIALGGLLAVAHRRVAASR